MTIKFTGDWDKVLRISDIAKIVKEEFSDEMEIFALEKQEEIKENIRAGGVPYTPLSELTAAIKGHRKPLINTGRLIGSITMKSIDSGNEFGVSMGIFRGEKSQKGEEMSRIAWVLDQGMDIRITADMFRKLDFLFKKYLNMPLPAGAKIVRIPGRHFISAALFQADKQWLEDAIDVAKTIFPKFNS